jgi:DNA-binding NarL/FixJ family response regulator
LAPTDLPTVKVREKVQPKRGIVVLPAAGRIRVVVVDDQQIARERLRAVLAADGRCEVVGEAADGDEVVEQVRAAQPDVVLMDLGLPRVSGIEAIRRVKRSWPDLPVIVVTLYEDVDLLYEAVRSGAVGYLLKDAPGAQLAHAILTTMDGGSLVAPSLLRSFLRRIATLPPGPWPVVRATSKFFSRRERDVLELLAQGLSNREIAGHLGIGEATVKTHLERIFATLGVSDRTQAAIWAVRNGWLGSPPPVPHRRGVQ